MSEKKSHVEIPSFIPPGTNNRVGSLENFHAVSFSKTVTKEFRGCCICECIITPVIHTRRRVVCVHLLFTNNSIIEINYLNLEFITGWNIKLHTNNSIIGKNYLNLEFMTGLKINY